MSEGSVLGKWREYFEELMYVENESERKDGEQLVNQEVQRISQEEMRAAMMEDEECKGVCPRMTYLWCYGDIKESGRWTF